MTEVVHAWVRYIDGKFVLSWMLEDKFGERAIRHRPMTFRERIGWYWIKRVPKP